MKKYLVIAFSLFYMSTAVGINVSFHYCTNQTLCELAAQSDKENCCCEGTSNASCCDTESFFFQLDDVQLLVQNSSKEVKLYKPVILPREEIEKGFNDKTITILEDLSLPPPEEPLWLLYCSPIYYG